MTFRIGQKVYCLGEGDSLYEVDRLTKTAAYLITTSEGGVDAGWESLHKLITVEDYNRTYGNYGLPPDEEDEETLFAIFCRSVGPGGTEVTFYKNSRGEIWAEWENENCPYEGAHEGHNVSKLRPQDIAKLKEALG